MRQNLTTIAFDADDTLWDNERFFHLTQTHFANLLSEYTEKPNLMARLEQAERRNIGHYGFGIKGFTLSMIETAVEVTQGRVSAYVIGEILQAGREMLRHPVDLLPHARKAVECAKQDHRTLLITKGDLLDQERKLAQSGLDEIFDVVEIVSDKTVDVYIDIFARHGDGATRGMMIGNSLKSDVIPMIEAGGWGVHVPHGLEWALESAPAPSKHPRFVQIQDLNEVSEVIRRPG
ncbi:MAG: HAD family hydrolase [Roseobacter sp.]